MFSFWSVLFPSRCAVCGHPMRPTDEVICQDCFLSLPRTRMKAGEENRVEKLFWGQVQIQDAYSYMIYYRGAASHNVLMALKYHHQPKIGIFFGRIIARELKESDFFKTIDGIVPVPISKARRRKRGYNQSEMLAQGLNEVTHIPIWSNVVERSVHNATQTHLMYSDRIKNVQGIFKMLHPEAIKGKHLLLVDDVITSGSTLLSLARTLQMVPGVTFSILTLAMSSSISEIPQYNLPPEPDTADDPQLYILKK